ncbi:MAG: lipocalin family protein [Bacteroidia bacterium]
MKSVYFVISLAFLLSIYSCGTNGSDEQPEPEFTQSQLALHGGDSKFWMLTKENYNGIDITASYKACELDNVYIFDKYDNQSIDAGATKCQDNPEPDVKRGYYKLDEVNNTLEIGSADTIYTVNILELSTSKLKWDIEVDGEVIERIFEPR